MAKMARALALCLLLLLCRAEAFLPGSRAPTLARNTARMGMGREMDPGRAKFNEIKRKKNERYKASQEAKAKAKAERYAEAAAKAKTERARPSTQRATQEPEQPKGFWPWK